MKKHIYNNLFRLLHIFTALALFSSCYSVRVVSRNGVPEPDFANTYQDFYRNKQLHVIDTTIRLKLQDGEFSLIKDCGSTGFFSFEYRNTLGGVLLSAVTFGKVRKVRVKYVCLKEGS